MKIRYSVEHSLTLIKVKLGNRRMIMFFVSSWDLLALKNIKPFAKEFILTVIKL